MPLVSVIVPAYKVNPYIAETLDSILAQTFQDFEIVVVNDGCPETEALEKVLAPYRSRIIYVRQTNQGPASARNTAIRSGTATKYLALIDGDDKWDPNYLKVQTEVMERNPDIDVLYCDARVFGDGRWTGQRFMQMCPSHGEVTLQSLVDQKCTVMVSVLARRDAVIKSGLFDPEPRLRGSEDFDLWARILKDGGKIAYHLEPLVYYRLRPTSLSANRVASCMSFIGVLEKLLGSTGISSQERNSVENRIQQVRAQMYWEEGRAAIRHGDAKEAIEKLALANQTLHSRRLNLLLTALRLWPRLAMRGYCLRSRVVRAMN